MRAEMPTQAESNNTDNRLYTFGPALRILHVKNIGMTLAPKELRICSRLMGGPPANHTVHMM